MMDFMDSLKRGVDRAGFEVDRLLRANRVRSRISGLRTEIDRELLDISKHVMELYERSEAVPAELRDRCEKVRRLEAEIVAREAELDAINNESPREAEQEYEASTAPIGGECPHCGQKLPEGANFCYHCGASLNVTVEAQPEQAVPSEPSEPTEPPAPAG
jgi:DNA repair exonuclease SbcCD ATPase subunit